MVYFIAETWAIQQATATIAEGYPELVRFVRCIEYSQLLSFDSLPFGTYIFTGTVDFNADRRELAMLVEKRVRQWDGKFRILNSPFLGRNVDLRLKESLAGELVTDVRSFPKGETAFQKINAPGSTGFADNAEELALALTDQILSGTDPNRIALLQADEVKNQVLIYGQNCLSLAGNQPISSHFAAKFGLDIFSLEFTDKSNAIAISDRLGDILPPTRPGSPLSRYITEAVSALDTIRDSSSVSIGLSWQSLATAIGLKSSS